MALACTAGANVWPGGLSLRARRRRLTPHCHVDDKAVLGRLRKMADWLEFLLGQLCCRRAATARHRPEMDAPGGRTMIAVRRRQTGGACALQSLSGRFDDLVLTLEKVGESVMRTAIGLGEMVITDRGYARCATSRRCWRRGSFISRIGWPRCGCTPGRRAFDPLAELRATSSRSKRWVRASLAQPLRFVIALIPEEKATKQRQRVARRPRAAATRSRPDPRGGELSVAGTALPDAVSAATVVPCIARAGRSNSHSRD